MITVNALKDKLLEGIIDLKVMGLKSEQNKILMKYIQEALAQDLALEAMLEQIVLRANLLSNKEAFIALVPAQIKKVFKPYMQNEMTSALGDFFEPDSQDVAMTKADLQSIFSNTLASQLNALIIKQYGAEIEAPRAARAKLVRKKHPSFLDTDNQKQYLVSSSIANRSEIKVLKRLSINDKKPICKKVKF